MDRFARVADTAVRSLNQQGWKFKSGVKRRVAEAAAMTERGANASAAKQAMIDALKADTIRSPYSGFPVNG